MGAENGGGWGYRGMSSDNIKGLVLALSSSVFIGASFIVKKKGLKKAGASGVRAGLDLYFSSWYCVIFASETLMQNGWQSVNLLPGIV